MWLFIDGLFIGLYLFIAYLLDWLLDCKILEAMVMMIHYKMPCSTLHAISTQNISLVNVESVSHQLTSVSKIKLHAYMNYFQFAFSLVVTWSLLIVYPRGWTVLLNQ